jgi:hypothetical protein
MVTETLKHAETEKNWLNQQVAATYSHGCIIYFYDLESPKQHESEQLTGRAKVTPPLSTVLTYGSIATSLPGFGLGCFPF